MTWVGDAMPESRYRVGDSVTTVVRARGWTAGEIGMYGSQLGTVVEISLHPCRCPILVQLHTGPCAGERRWFSDTEIADDASSADE